MAPGEAFAPEDEDEPFDLRRPHVMTALGPIAPSALGMTVFAGEQRGEPEGELVAALGDWEDASARGLGAIVIGRWPLRPSVVRDLRWVAERATAHLVVAARWREGDARGAELARRLEEGVDGAGLRAGMIGVRLDPNVPPRGAVAAIAPVQRATGLPIVVDAARGSRPATLVAMFDQDEGIPPAKVIVDPQGGQLEEWHWRMLLESGVFVFIDGLALTAGKAQADVPLIRRMVAAGHAGQLLAAKRGVKADSRRWSAFVERFPIDLMEAGIDAPAVRRLFIDNPARALTVGPVAGGG